MIQELKLKSGLVFRYSRYPSVEITREGIGYKVFSKGDLYHFSDDEVESVSGNDIGSSNSDIINDDISNSQVKEDTVGTDWSKYSKYSKPVIIVLIIIFLYKSPFVHKIVAPIVDYGALKTMVSAGGVTYDDLKTIAEPYKTKEINSSWLLFYKTNIDEDRIVVTTGNSLSDSVVLGMYSTDKESELEKSLSNSNE